ncbi:MAG: class I SAM-dependent methyltransferase [Minisyncoccia bacterium]
MDNIHATVNTKDVETWWEANPFAFGVSNTARDQVGTIPLEKMDLAYFDTIESQFRKLSRGAAQNDGAPLFSNLVDPNSLKGKKVLDIAVGSGFSAVAFVRAGAEVTGIDLTAFAVQHAKKNLSLRGLPATIEQMDAQAMTFPDASFDFVNAWGCLMHMPDTEKAIQEIYRVLKPGGKMLAYMYNKASWPYWFNYFLLRGVLMGDLIRYRFDMVKVTSRHSDGYSVGGNPLAKFFNPSEVDGMLARAGFSKHKVEPWRLAYEPDNWPVRRLPLFRYLPAFVKRRMTRYGYGLIVYAEK